MRWVLLLVDFGRVYFLSAHESQVQSTRLQARNISISDYLLCDQHPSRVIHIPVMHEMQLRASS